MIAFLEILTDISDVDAYCEYQKILNNNTNRIIILFSFADFMTNFYNILF